MTDALKVALDALREALGECDVVRWVESPDAVRELLKHKPWRDYAQCADCDAMADDAHRRDCAVADAWRVLGDSRGAEDIERAHAEALAMRPRGRTAAQEFREAGGIFGVQPTTYEQWRAMLADPNIKEGQVIAFSPEDFRLAAMRPAVTTTIEVTCSLCGERMAYQQDSNLFFCAGCGGVDRPTFGRV